MIKEPLTKTERNFGTAASALSALGVMTGMYMLVEWIQQAG
jgi:hypothetical protein